MKYLFLLLWIAFGCLPIYGQSTTSAYSSLIQKIESKRLDFKKSYDEVNSSKRDSLITQAKDYLKETLTQEVFPHWYGTPWDFNGHTRIPNKGKIACGYFVTNTLSDMGFNIPRIKWAQSASEVFIKQLADSGIKRFLNKSITEIEAYLKKEGVGVYLVGLDYHTGFVVVEKDSIRFVHSSYYRPEIGVMSESIRTRNPLYDSKYRVFGKLFSNEMVRNWINGTDY